MFGAKKEAASSQPSTEIANPLAAVKVEGDTVILGAGSSADMGGSAPDDLISKDELQEMLDAETFYEYVAKALDGAGDVTGYRSLATPEPDKAFRKACDRLHARLMDNVTLDFLGGVRRQTLEDIIVFGFGFGPLAMGVAKEYVAKKKQPKGAPRQVVEKKEETNGGS